MSDAMCCDRCGHSLRFDDNGLDYCPNDDCLSVIGNDAFQEMLDREDLIREDIRKEEENK